MRPKAILIIVLPASGTMAVSTPAIHALSWRSASPPLSMLLCPRLPSAFSECECASMAQTKTLTSKIKAIHCNTQDHSFHVHTDIEHIDQIRAEPDSLLWL